jgi:integrase
MGILIVQKHAHVGFLVIIVSKDASRREGLIAHLPISIGRGNFPLDLFLQKATTMEQFRTGRVEAVPHGFRSSFKTWCQERTNYADEVSELALSHVNSDVTRAAYARGELLAKRTRLMRGWAKFLATVPNKASVTPMRRGK